VKALVTGGGGFLGRYVVEELLAAGHAVTALGRGRYPELEALGVPCVRADLADLSAVRSAVAGHDAVLHVAALSGVWGPREAYERANVLATRNVLEACRDAGVRRLVHTSSPSVVFDGRDHVDEAGPLPYPRRYLCHYPRTKALAERMVLQASGRDGLFACALRPHLIIGPRDPHLLPRLIGLDEITGGGLPKGRPTLIAAAPAPARPASAMEFLVRGATQYGEPGVFMTFEERPEDLTTNVASLGFDLKQMVQQRQAAHIDYVRVERSEIEETGEYDLEGLFVRLGYAIDSSAPSASCSTPSSRSSPAWQRGDPAGGAAPALPLAQGPGVTAIITGEQGEKALTRHGLEEYVSTA
jgi:hypothetical protein